MTDASQSDGTVRTECQYDAWGSYRNSTAPSATDPKLGYTGHQFDPETGLTYARARYYDSELGIFLSRDSKDPESGDAPWLHRYAYVRMNPARYTDLDGLDVGAARALSPDDFLRESQNIDALNRFTADNSDPMAEVERTDNGGAFKGLRVNPALGSLVVASTTGAEVVKRAPVVVVPGAALLGGFAGGAFEAARQWAFDEPADVREMILAADTGAQIASSISVLPTQIAAVPLAFLGGVGVYQGSSSALDGLSEHNPKKLIFGAATTGLSAFAVAQGTTALEFPRGPPLSANLRSQIGSVLADERGSIALQTSAREDAEITALTKYDPRFATQQEWIWRREILGGQDPLTPSGRELTLHVRSEPLIQGGSRSDEPGGNRRSLDYWANQEIFGESFCRGRNCNSAGEKLARQAAGRRRCEDRQADYHGNQEQLRWSLREQEAELVARIHAFIDGRDRSAANAQLIEGALAALFPEDDEIDDVIEILATYAPGAERYEVPNFLVGEREVIVSLNGLLEILKKRGAISR